jgi:23S rRNA (guanosine2251-2'-O)-methyltransferase
MAPLGSSNNQSMSEIIYRRNAVLETLRANRRHIERLWLQKGLDKKLAQPLLNEAKKRNIPVLMTDKQKLGHLAQDSKHQGVVLEVGAYPYRTVEEMLAVAQGKGERPFLLLLDLLHGPQNIGSLLRTAEICGVHGVILQDRRAPEITPTVVQYAAGATEHLLIAQVTNLVNTMRFLKENDIWIVGTDLSDAAQLYGKVDLNIPIGLVIGHEGQGMRRLVRDNCDILLKLPQRGHIESLNAAVAGSILLYGIWQARDFEMNG